MHKKFSPSDHFSHFDFQNCRHVVVAVSGGSDSMALLLSLHTYFSSLVDAPKLSAVTVDHGLRAGAASEAAQVAEICARLRVPHMIKTWNGIKPSSGIQAAARMERRTLLCHSAAELGADVIMTGHTLDDHVETVVMRQRRGSGPGIAGIASASLAYNDRGDGAPIWILRPLLDVTRADLQIYLSDIGVFWIDDPSNQNDAFERIAVRNQLLTKQQIFVDDIVKVSTIAADNRTCLAKLAGSLLEQHVREVAPGLVMIDAAAFSNGGLPELTVLLRALIAFAGGSSSLGDGSIVQKIAEQVVSFAVEKGKKPWRETSNGALIDIRNSGVYLLREARSGQRTGLEFDGRYRTTGLPMGIGSPYSREAGWIVPASLVQRAANLEPYYINAQGIKLLAMEAVHSGNTLRRLLNPWPDLLPLFDLSLAKNLNRLAGIGDFPAIPVYCAGKN